MDKHSCTELYSLCLNKWAFGSIFHCPLQASRWGSEDLNQGKEVGTYREWFRDPELEHKADDVNSQVLGHTWEWLRLLGAKGAQWEAGLSAVYIISTFIPLHIDSAEHKWLGHLHFCSKNSQESLQRPVTWCLVQVQALCWTRGRCIPQVTRGWRWAFKLIALWPKLHSIW